MTYGLPDSIIVTSGRKATRYVSGGRKSGMSDAQWERTVGGAKTVWACIEFLNEWQWRKLREWRQKRQQKRSK